MRLFQLSFFGIFDVEETFSVLDVRYFELLEELKEFVPEFKGVKFCVILKYLLRVFSGLLVLHFYPVLIALDFNELSIFLFFSM